ncbi:MAG: zinc ribbon domain-containing protein [Oscillospiraceae bacterium]|nr:zinc ribbon domain-containing protein [Oscillospiraceae bacterium]
MEMKDIPSTLSKIGDDVLTGAESLAKGALDGSKKVAEYFRLKNTISQAESRLNAGYIELGKKFEELYGTKAAPEFAELLAQIADARAQIAISRAELIALDSAAICGQCGKYLQAGQRFCPNCGAKQFTDPTSFLDPNKN